MNQFRMRLIVVVIILLAGAAAVIGRLFTVQVIESRRYVERSRDQTQQRKITPANRGSIVDRNGVALATSVGKSIRVDPSILGIERGKPGGTALVKRLYPFGDMAGSLLGYIGTDGNGLGGVEFAYDTYLRGEDGWLIMQKDGRNNRYRKIGLPEKRPRDGYDVILTIDLHIQQIVQTVLKQSVEKLRARNGVCIVMNPVDGSILAMANEPSFNPNMPSRYTIAQRQNRCISMVYEPGSTFKLVTASAAMQEGIKKENDLLFGDNGSYRVYDQTIRDHIPYGYLTFAKALTYSSNICFAKIANDIGNEKFYRYVRDYGFGNKTAIGLPGEECGIVHPVKEWSGRTRVTMAMGQELSVTLLQMILPFGAIANGGVLLSPRILDKVKDSDGTIIDSGTYKPVRRLVSEEVAARMRLMLRDVVENGTGKQAAITGLSVGGKTGTSQKPDSGGYSQTKSWSSFFGFVPAENPMLLCGVMIDEPAGGEMGGEAAAPVFKKIITQILSHPELEFAAKILDSKDVTNQDSVPQFVRSAIKTESIESSTSLYKNSDGLPDCVGKDLRDAVNVINEYGIKPFAVGGGIVKRQSYGVVIKKNAVKACTLYCSIKG